MSLRNDLAVVLARDSALLDPRLCLRLRGPRIHQDPQEAAPSEGQAPGAAPEQSRHVSGRELCEGARLLALAHYGMLAMAVLDQWGIRSTSDLGEIVYNLIASGDLEQAATDSRADFDHVYDFETALRRDFVLALDDVA